MNGIEQPVARQRQHRPGLRGRDKPSGRAQEPSRPESLPRAWWSRWVTVAKGGTLPQDTLSGLTVAAVALPLNLALAVASGLPPAAGLVAGAIGGGLAAVFGGSALQVTGPAAALSTMVFALVAKFGVAGAAAAALVVGVVELALGFLRTGKLAEKVPESVLAGFTTGVGLKLLDNQIPELMGFDYRVAELAQMIHRPEWLHEVSWFSVLSGLAVAFFVVAMKPYKRIPAALIGIAVVTGVSSYVDWKIERVGELPSALPNPGLPALGDQWPALVLATLPLALLAAAESLLSARATDRMATGIKPHHADLELVGQGIANVAVGLFGGLPVSGVVVRSGVNVQSGGRTRLAALIHGAMLMAAMLFLGTMIAKVPLAALAGLLCVVGLRLVEVTTLVHLWREHKLEAVAFVAACAGTVSGHLMLGLGVGMAIHLAGAFLNRGAREEQERRVERKAKGIRAVLGEGRSEARRPNAHATDEAPSHAKWLAQIRQRAQVATTAFVHRQASVIGRVVLGDHVHIAAGSSVRADEGTPFFIGSNSNIQDGVVIHALKDKKVQVAGEDWAVYVGRNVSIAHDALVHGPCYIGDDSFVGFKAVVHDAIVGAHCYIGIGAVVVGVEIPDGRFVPHGRIVDSADAVDALPLATQGHHEFNEDVVDVNRGLAAAYHALHGPQGRPSASAAPTPPGHPTPALPAPGPHERSHLHPSTSAPMHGAARTLSLARRRRADERF